VSRDPRITALRDHLIGLAKRHGITIQWVSDRYAAAANVHRKWMRAAAVTDDETAMICAHELAHVIFGHCARCRTAGRRGGASCLACELRAHRGAVALLQPFGVSRTMHESGAVAVWSYAADTTDAEREAVRRAIGDVQWRRDQLARVRMRDRAALIRKWKQEARTT
jgi:hypothetical protein